MILVAPVTGGAVGGVTVVVEGDDDVVVVAVEAVDVFFFELVEVPVSTMATTTTATAITATGMVRVFRRRRFCACCNSAMRVARPARWRARLSEGTSQHGSVPATPCM